ncbi:3-oxoadipate enol-lactonase/proline iminopeptidase [Streptosporangium subroseum]|uniref:3-oxoadipate enol-lactonase/proline iminopeptidase n=1 Tax=Streptosporangium subroseum TaxID=106412 RepID=A0A239GD71_9ACTN|nr:alpha/beta hydrolase [Streptosporangium subroseum]SNS67266.1 3-oxoadipate enol-lactonase/proline iminopeptidase [Streptosporangium subroseum]
MFTESVVAVSAEPVVELFVAQTPGPADRTLLVIHGGPDWDHTYLREPLAELAGRHRVILADLRGCGRSTRGLSDDRYTPAAATADLVALLDAFGTPRIDVLGFSYGGLIAQRLVLAAPERVRRLVIASSSVLPVPPDAFDGWHEREERRAPEAAVWSDTSLSGPELTRAAAVAGAGANVWRPEVLPAYLDRLAGVHFSGEWMRSWRVGALPTARHPDAAQRLAALGVPLLLLHGRQDMIFPVALVDETTRLIPSARAVVIEEAGHMAHVDQPRAWLDAVAGFLS